jgi:hypothetical protein
VHQSPGLHGIPRSRWTLAHLQQKVSFLTNRSLATVWRTLHRFGIAWKRGRGHLTSPDPNYLAKLTDILELIRKSKQDPKRWVVLFADELTFYRQPSVSMAYDNRGHDQPLAELGHRANTSARVASALNIWSGQVTSLIRSHFGVRELVSFYERIRETYPEAEAIWLIEDNWPVHFHPDVLAALEPQQLKYPVRVTPYWSKEPTRRVPERKLPIQIVSLPTYAPWTNPVEKLWRKLRQELLHLHAFKDAWLELNAAVQELLQALETGSEDLLRYVGLSDPTALYHSSFTQKGSLCTNGT